jgi:AcrR family transcriptional regulator
MTRRRGIGAAHENQRTAIADAFLAVVAERGLPAASMRSVAARASVSLGRVQHYFASRDRLLEAGFDRANERSSARIAELLGGDPDHAPAHDTLNVVLTQLIPHDPFSWTHLRIRQSFIARGLTDERVATRLRTDYERLHRRLGNAVRRGQRAGSIRPDIDPVTVAARLVAHAEGLANYVLLRVTTPDQAHAAVLASLRQLQPQSPPRTPDGRGA